MENVERGRKVISENGGARDYKAVVVQGNKSHVMFMAFQIPCFHEKKKSQQSLNLAQFGICKDFTVLFLSISGVTPISSTMER
jgi:hypothetical protein